jgi:hypothetical protein
MPIYYAKHLRVRTEDNPDKRPGNSVPWEKKYTGACGYFSYSEMGFVDDPASVDCKKCRGKMVNHADLRFNRYDVPNMTDEELKVLHEHLKSRRCPACHARSGNNCKDGKGRGIEHVHMGRLPDGFDSAIWLVNHRAKTMQELK